MDVERWALKNLNLQQLVGFGGRNAPRNEIGALFCLLNRLDDLVEVWPVAGVEFGMEQFAIGVNLESAAARGNQRERLDALAELKDFGRQTDSLRRVVSNDAVFDRDLGLHRQTPFRERNYRRGSKRSSCAVILSGAKDLTQLRASRKLGWCDQLVRVRSLAVFAARDDLRNCS